jgi:hypothetical protein
MSGPLTEARQLAEHYLLDADPLNASSWFLECAKICIRRGVQDLIVADVIDAMQRYMADASHERLEHDRGVLRSIVDHYDELSAG